MHILKRPSQGASLYQGRCALAFLLQFLCPARKATHQEIPGATLTSVKQRLQAEFHRSEVDKKNIPALAEEAGEGFMVWKDAITGLMRWFAVYSNNFRDQDNPSEIISEKSHQTYVELVDEGVVDYPELWLWHIKGTAWGKADWVAYDHGFAMASGLVYKGYEYIAKNLSRMGNLRVSHGMIKTLLVYDPHDKSVILFHVTAEISPLPDWAAANMLTGFVVLDEGDLTMALPQMKKTFLSKAGISDAKLAEMDSDLAKASKLATESGLESKEVSEEEDQEIAEFDTGELVASTEDTEEEVEEEVEVEEVPKPTPVKAKKSPWAAEDEEETPKKKPAKKKEATAGIDKTTPTEIPDVVDFATKSEVAAVLVILFDSLGQLTDQVESLTKELAALKAEDEEKIAVTKELTPTLSLMDMISGRNPIGKEAAKVKGTTLLGKDGPKETAAPIGAPPTMIGLVNDLMTMASNGGKTAA